MSQPAATEISFTVYCHPEPQGSMKAFVRNGRAALTSDNRKLKPFRQEVAQTAMFEVARCGVEKPMFGKHVAVEMEMRCYFRRPLSIPKKRIAMVVKPDQSKLLRAVEDALTGIVYHDDAQITRHVLAKAYDGVERVEITVRLAEQV